MKMYKSFLRFTRKQRKGILILLLLIIGLQLGIYELRKTKEFSIDEYVLSEFQSAYDSIKQIRRTEKKQEIFPFNPNFISDYKGYTLGMTVAEIDRLHAFRKEGKWINNSRQFQKVTGISDSLFDIISPYFKFPDWINQSRPSSKKMQFSKNRVLTYDQKQDLNSATAKQLQQVYGIGPALSERIIRFRDSFDGGFIADVQLNDVRGLSEEVIERIKALFTVKTPRQVDKVNINEATTDELVRIQHIDYELAYEIIRQRTLREGFRDWAELTKVKGFPLNKSEIIKLYLSLD